MTKIYKHQFDWYMPDVEIRQCLKILSIGVQKGLPTVWYAHSEKPEFEPADRGISKTLYIRMTGEDFPLDKSFIGTLMTDDQEFVIHIFADS
jgi:hypothetical protein